MSQENVEIVRDAAEAFLRGDWEGLRAGLDPHVLIRLDANWPEQHFYGRDAWIDFSKSSRELLGPDVRIEETQDLGDRVLIRWYWKAHGERSGLEQDLRWSEIVTLRDGRYVFVELFLDHREALKAVGLEE